MEAANAEHKPTRFENVRKWVLLVLGVGIVIYSLIPPVNPGALVVGGGMLGADNVLKAQAK